MKAILVLDKMPNKCSECQLVEYCRKKENNSIVPFDEDKARRPFRCPLRPLPEMHGKIGDIDRLYEVFKKNVVGADAFKELFDIAPAIIEADKGEQNESSVSNRN